MGSNPASQTGSVLLAVRKDQDDPQAWSAFVDRYGPKVYAWCCQWRLQPADAEDVTQEVLAKLVQKLRTSYDPAKGSFRGWLKTLTRHAWSDYLATQRSATVGSGDSDVVERLHSLEARDDLLQALAEVFDLELLAEAQTRVKTQVQPRDWEIFQQLAIEGRSGPDVAREHGMKPSAVLTVRSRVQEKLRQQIQRLEGASPAPPEEAS
jgi:RNA polymerase sigma-70 factor (ECF subfamily)